MEEENEVSEVASDEPDLGAAYDKIMARDESEPEGDDVSDDSVADDAEPEQEAEETAEAPSNLPYEVRQHWAEMPEGAREAVTAAHKELSEKLTEQGRIVSGLKPIRDTLVEMVQEIPEMSGMKPEDVAAEMKSLAQVSQAFNRDPLGAIMGLARQHGLEHALAQQFGGQQPGGEYVNALQQRVNELEGYLQQMNPDNLFQEFERRTTERSVLEKVNEFANSAEAWGQVEEHMPAAIDFVKRTLGGDASPEKVLETAYELAIERLAPEAKAKLSAAEQAAEQRDPERAEAASKAKSVNVNGARTGRKRAMSEREMLSAKYDELMGRA